MFCLYLQGQCGQACGAPEWPQGTATTPNWASDSSDSTGAVSWEPYGNTCPGQGHPRLSPQGVGGQPPSLSPRIGFHVVIGCDVNWLQTVPYLEGVQVTGNRYWSHRPRAGGIDLIWWGGALGLVTLLSMCHATVYVSHYCLCVTLLSMCHIIVLICHSHSPRTSRPPFSHVTVIVVTRQGHCPHMSRPPSSHVHRHHGHRPHTSRSLSAHVMATVLTRQSLSSHVTAAILTRRGRCPHTSRPPAVLTRHGRPHTSRPPSSHVTAVLTCHGRRPHTSVIVLIRHGRRPHMSRPPPSHIMAIVLARHRPPTVLGYSILECLSLVNPSLQSVYSAEHVTLLNFTGCNLTPQLPGWMTIYSTKRYWLMGPF